MIWFTSDHHFGHGRIVGYCGRPWWRPALPEELEPGHHLAKVARVHSRVSPKKKLGELGGLQETHYYKVPDVAVMEDELVTRWNERVAPGDTVYHLGDFAWWHLGVDEVARIRARLNGEILLVRGNHDQEQKAARGSGEKPLTAAVREVFGEAPHARLVGIGERWVLLYHYGPRSWGGSAAAKKHASRLLDVDQSGSARLLLHGHSHCKNGAVVGGPWTWGRHSPIPTVDMSVEGWDYAPASFDEILARVNKGGSA